MDKLTPLERELLEALKDALSFAGYTITKGMPAPMIYDDAPSWVSRAVAIVKKSEEKSNG